MMCQMLKVVFNDYYSLSMARGFNVFKIYILFYRGFDRMIISYFMIAIIREASQGTHLILFLFLIIWNVWIECRTK